jgi:serine/threonine protein kinase
MPLSPGDQLGPYEIVGPLGSGGMGDVYRARDNRLRREVALKMLADAAVNDAESLARFDRETHAVATLNHPNILAIHDSGTHNGVPYAVTELLEGETLADRLRSGPLAPPRATEIASQVAEGLAAAHVKGVIHRDIKPENIFLTHDGRAKILDFGIARIEKLATLSPSRASQKSSSAMLIGTAGYVSPEQVRGKRADARSDVFSLGAVYYEMLTGRRAFVRGTAVETLGAVLRDDPRDYPETAKVPEALKPFVFRCLEKDPADRYQSARDLLMDLRAWQAELTQDSAKRVKFRSVPPWQQRRSRIYLRAVGGALLFVLGLFAGSCWERNRWRLATNPAGHTTTTRP